MFQVFLGCLFSSDVEYFSYCHLVLPLWYIFEIPWTQKFASLNVNRPIRWKSENIAQYNIDDGVFIRHKYNRERKLVPFVKRLKYIIRNPSVQMQECRMFPFMLKFYFLLLSIHIFIWRRKLVFIIYWFIVQRSSMNLDVPRNLYRSIDISFWT